MASARPAWAAGGSSASLLSVSGDLIAETSTLSVSEEVSAGLSALNSLSQADASALLDAVWAALTASTAGGAGFIIPALSTRLADSEPAKLAGAAVATLLLEAARLGAPEEAVRAALSAQGLLAETASATSRTYASRLRALRELHKGPGLLLPKLVDVDWRLDYVVKSSTAGAVNEPLFVVKLTTSSPTGSVLQHVQFTCSPAQLQDLLGKVTDATRSVTTVSRDL